MIVTTRFLLSMLAMAAIAAAAWLVVADEGRTEVDAAAQPPDNPGDTGPGPRTTTAAEPASPSVQQVEIRVRFGKACGDSGLCYEIAKPSQLLADSFDRDPSLPRGARPVFDTYLTLGGEVLEHGSIMACQLGASSDSYNTMTYGWETVDSQLRLFGSVPLLTPRIEIPGVELLQLRVKTVDSTDQFFAATAPADMDPERFSTNFDQYAGLTDSEINAHSGRPATHQTCGEDS